MDVLRKALHAQRDALVAATQAVHTRCVGCGRYAPSGCDACRCRACGQNTFRKLRDPPRACCTQCRFLLRECITPPTRSQIALVVAKLALGWQRLGGVCQPMQDAARRGILPIPQLESASQLGVTPPPPRSTHALALHVRPELPREFGCAVAARRVRASLCFLAYVKRFSCSCVWEIAVKITRDRTRAWRIVFAYVRRNNAPCARSDATARVADTACAIDAQLFSECCTRTPLHAAFTVFDFVDRR